MQVSTREIIRIKKTIEEEYPDIFHLRGPYAYHWPSTFHHLAYLRAISQNWNRLSDLEKIFLDVGCGSGKPAIDRAHEEWKSYGIDIGFDQVKIAQRNASDAKSRNYLSRMPIFFHANFFPEDFEYSVSEESNHYSVWEENQLRSPRCRYVGEQLSLDSISLFYHYQVVRGENLLRHFRNVAKPGALFFIERVIQEPVEIPSGVEAVNLFEGDRQLLYRKK